MASELLPSPAVPPFPHAQDASNPGWTVWTCFEYLRTPLQLLDESNTGLHWLRKSQPHGDPGNGKADRLAEGDDSCPKFMPFSGVGPVPP